MLLSKFDCKDTIKGAISQILFGEIRARVSKTEG